MGKRNRSLGSTQAFICELALSDHNWIGEKLKPFCIGNGINILLPRDYLDNIYFERLIAYKEKRPVSTSPTIVPKTPDAKKLYYNGGR